MSTMHFIVDTVGDDQLEIKTELADAQEKVYGADTSSKIERILEIFKTTRLELDRKAKIELDFEQKLSSMKIDSQFDDFYTDMGWTIIPGLPVKKEKKSKKFHFSQLNLDTGKLKTTLGSVDVEKEMEGSVLKPGIEKEHNLPQYHMSERKLREERKKERSKTKGPEWFNLPAPEMTEEVKNDLQVLKMRSVLDPKTFKKRNDMEVLPKYFQVGRVMDNPLDHQSERIPNKQRKRTLLDELLADAEFQKYNKRKYKQIIEEKRKSQYRTHMRDKRQKSKEIKRNRKSKA